MICSPANEKKKRLTDEASFPCFSVSRSFSLHPFFLMRRLAVVKV